MSTCYLLDSFDCDSTSEGRIKEHQPSRIAAEEAATPWTEDEGEWHQQPGRAGVTLSHTWDSHFSTDQTNKRK